MIDIHSYTNRGAQPTNQDFFGISNKKERFIAVVCDGLGGHKGGETASKMAVDGFMENLPAMQNITNEDIEALLTHINDGLCRVQNEMPDLKSMRTTAVGCVIENNVLRFFNCGDSRFYYFSGGEIREISNDHSILQVNVRQGEMSFDSIRFHPDRSRLLKALGGDNGGKNGSVYDTITVTPGDAFLLCSDGFWEYVLENEMEIDLSKSTSAKEWVEYMLVRLMLRFSEKNDNFTVVGGMIK